MILRIFVFFAVIVCGYAQVLHHHPDHLHNPVHAEIITKHFGDTDVQVEHDVILLTKDNFYYMVGAHEILLALFGVPWDPKFEEVLLQFEKAAKQLQQEHPSICLGRMDVSAHPEIVKKMDIRGDEPQFMFFYKNRAYNFEHSWKADAIVKELIKRQEAIWYPPQNLPEHITEILPKDIEKIAKKDFSLLLLYSPTRLSSYRVLMELENAAAALNRTDTFFKVNVADVKDLRNEFGVPPVIKIFRRGRAYEYKGPKVAKGMVKYLQSQMQPPFVRGLTPQEVESFLSKHQDKPTVIGYFENERLPQFQLFTEVANMLRGELYFVVIRQFMSSPGWKDKVEDEQWRIGVMLPKRDSDPELIKAKDVSIAENNLKTLEELLTFIAFKAVPLVGHRTKKNKDGFQYNRRPLLISYTKVDWSTTSAEKETLFVRHRIAQVAIEYPIQKLTFVMSDVKEFKDELSRFGFTDLDQEKELRLGIIGADGEMYPFHTEDRITSAEIKKFAEDYLAGKLVPFRRSEKPLTAEENTDAVKAVQGATFKEFVLSNPKDVVISFCHPLCTICETLEQNLMKIAQKSEYPNTEFFAMDTSLNDPPASYRPRTYPTLYFASEKNKTAPIRYSGKDWSVKEIHRFLDKHVSQARVLSKSEL
ncbi:probable protein disulfide-isomerase A4 [Paramacrobiotus metropolitanus]|uniref:probable protein disulfide-isomerase A4 n=1 Tax=Paramacrobiotus metropolitanus TaxID=2943436 RepID=UPI002445BC45|nr:probable protein disulfide-isomerase A4 [Paramacrobiotus metropolitanus]